MTTIATIGDHQPRDVDAEDGVDRVVGEVRAAADQRTFEDDVGEGGQHAAGHAPHLAEAVGDEAVERAGRGDVPGHRDVTEREQRQDDRREQEAGRGAETVAESDRDRGVAGHGGDRCGVGHRHEDDGDDPDRALLEADVGAGGSFGFSGHRGSPGSEKGSVKRSAALQSSVERRTSGRHSTTRAAIFPPTESAPGERASE